MEDYNKNIYNRLIEDPSTETWESTGLLYGLNEQESEIAVDYFNQIIKIINVSSITSSDSQVFVFNFLLPFTRRILDGKKYDVENLDAKSIYRFFIDIVDPLLKQSDKDMVIKKYNIDIEAVILGKCSDLFLEKYPEKH